MYRPICMDCPICKNPETRFIHKFNDGPALQQKLHATRESALKEKKVSLNLYGCDTCSFVFNADFDASNTEYNADYENTQSHSKFFHAYLTDLAKRLVNTYDLTSKRVVEVGCGKGQFLKILYELGVTDIQGFDPSYTGLDPAIDAVVAKTTFNKENVRAKADFIVCRHVLDQVQNPAGFVSSIGECLADGGVVYFEFPSLEWMVKHRVFFNFFYEYCSYFTQQAAFRLFSRCGFGAITFRQGLRGEYIQIEAARGNSNADGHEYTNVSLESVSQFIKKEIEKYQKLIAELGSFVVWGAGGKGVTFLNRMGIHFRQSPYVIDINPNKMNKFIPVTGQKIVAPDILKTERIENILITNPLYAEEIRSAAAKNGYTGNSIIV